MRKSSAVIDDEDVPTTSPAVFDLTSEGRDEKESASSASKHGERGTVKITTVRNYYLHV